MKELINAFIEMEADEDEQEDEVNLDWVLHHLQESNHENQDITAQKRLG